MYATRFVANVVFYQTYKSARHNLSQNGSFDVLKTLSAYGQSSDAGLLDFPEWVHPGYLTMVSNLLGNRVAERLYCPLVALHGNARRPSRLRGECVNVRPDFRFRVPVLVEYSRAITGQPIHFGLQHCFHTHLPYRPLRNRALQKTAGYLVDGLAPTGEGVTAPVST